MISIWPIDRTLSGSTNMGQSGPGSTGSKGVFYIPQSFKINETSLSDFEVLYPGNSFGESHLSAEMQLVYSTASVD